MKISRILPILLCALFLTGFARKHRIGKDTPNSTSINAEFDSIYRALNKLKLDTGVEVAGAIAEVTAKARRLYLKNIRAEQVYPGALQTDDDGQGQVDDLYYGKLARLAGADALYRTVENTLIYFSDGSVYTITLDGTDGGSEFLGSMVMTSTDTYWTTGDVNTIRVNGYVDVANETEIVDYAFTDEFSVYPDTVTDWNISYSANVGGYGVTDGYYWAYFPNSTLSSVTMTRQKSYTVPVSTTLTIYARYKIDEYNVTDEWFGFNTSLGIMGIYLRSTLYDYLAFRYSLNGVDMNFTTFCDEGFIEGDIYECEVSYSSKTFSYKVIRKRAGVNTKFTGSIVSQYAGNVTPYVAGQHGKDYFYVDYYRETYKYASTDLEDIYDMATIAPVVNTSTKCRGLGIEVGNGKAVVTSAGGFQILDNSEQDYDYFTNQGADGGKVAIYTESVAGVDFFVAGATFATSIEYDGSEITFGTTTRTAGDTYADDIYGDNAVIADTVTASGIVLDNVNLTSNNFGLVVSSNVYINGKSSAAFHYGSGKYLTDLPKVSTATYSSTYNLNYLRYCLVSDNGSVLVSDDGNILISDGGIGE